VKSAPSAAKCNSRLGLSLSGSQLVLLYLVSFAREPVLARAKSFTVSALRRINTAQMLLNTANTLWPFVPGVCIVSQKPAAQGFVPPYLVEPWTFRKKSYCDWQSDMKVVPTIKSLLFRYTTMR
jgi:hypothetical protein